MLKKIINSQSFLELTKPTLRWFALATIFFIIVGLYLSLVKSPADYQQSEAVRIMYVHVPSAWMSLFIYACIAGSSAIALIWKNPVAFIFAKASSPIGALFTLITLVTGSLWGKPMWGTWWVWDARLTSVLLLFFIYIAHISLLNAFDNPKRGERPSAILALVGIINLPIIKWSVDWWNTLHQPASVTRLDTPAIHYEMLIPLLVMSLSFMLYYITIVIIRMHNEIVVRKINSLRIS